MSLSCRVFLNRCGKTIVTAAAAATEEEKKTLKQLLEASSALQKQMSDLDPLEREAFQKHMSEKWAAAK